MSESRELIKAMKGRESGHWYSRDGLLVSQVLGSDGKKYVDPDIRHARKYGFVPGVTAISKVLFNKPLTDWIIENAIKTCRAYPSRSDETEDDYILRMLKESGKYAKETGDTGKAIHADIQEWYLNKKWPESEVSRKSIRQIDAFLNETLVGMIGEIQSVSPEHSFVNLERGYGGQIDMLVVGTKANAKLDWKTNDLTKFKKPYDSWGEQLGAYNQGVVIEGPASNLSYVYSGVIDRNTGEVRMFLWDERDLADSTAVWNAAYEIWTMRNSYDPRKWVAA